jgi:hypothetical protein
MHRLTILSILLGFSLFIIACNNTSTNGTSAPPSPEPERSSADETLVIDPDEASPGDTVNLYFPDEQSRAVAFALKGQKSGEWTPKYLLISDPEGYTPSMYRRPWVEWDEREGWEEIAIRGPGPDPVVIPPPATPGRYRICTLDPKDKYCGEIEVRSNAPPSPEPERSSADETLVIDPDEASPGDTVNLYFPDEQSRAVAFALKGQKSGEWTPKYLLISDPEGYTPSMYRRPWVEWDEREGWEEIAIRGPGPDPVVIPPPATPGRYRICTLDPKDKYCGEIEVRSN